MSTKVNLTLFLVILATLASCKDVSKEKAQEMTINVVEAITSTNNTQKEFSFIAKPLRTSELSFRVGGPIDRLDVYAGNYYKHGSIIAEIDPRDFRIRKERAEALYQQAKAEYKRIETLYNMENLSASLYEKAKAEYTSAKMAYEAAVNELADTRLIAPFNGYVGEVYMEKFQDVKATQPVLSLIDIDQLKIEIYVTQDIALSAQKLQSVKLQLDAFPQQTMEAKIVEVSKSTTRNNLSYLLTALLPNEKGELLAGMSGKVFFDVTTNAQEPIVTIPQTALCHRPTAGNYVWTVNTSSGTVSQRNVTVGELLADGRISIIAGLEEKETVAVSGLRFLSDGMTVTIKEHIGYETR